MSELVFSSLLFSDFRPCKGSVVIPPPPPAHTLTPSNASLVCLPSSWDTVPTLQLSSLQPALGPGLPTRISCRPSPELCSLRSAALSTSLPPTCCSASGTCSVPFIRTAFLANSSLCFQYSDCMSPARNLPGFSSIPLITLLIGT